MLLDKGANINMQAGWYSNTLYTTLLEGHQGIVKLLLDKEVDINI
jgi:hypothetical protein